MALVRVAFIGKSCFTPVRSAACITRISRDSGHCGAEISMTLLVGRAGEAMDKFNHVAKNVGMLQIGGVLAHNNPHS